MLSAAILTAALCTQCPCQNAAIQTAVAPSAGSSHPVARAIAAAATAPVDLAAAKIRRGMDRRNARRSRR